MRDCRLVLRPPLPISAGAAPDAYTERALVDAFSSHPALAADVVAEARQIRQCIAQHALQAQQAQQARQGPAAQLAAAAAPPEGRMHGGEAGAVGDEAQLRQGELVIDNFSHTATTPMAGTAYSGGAQHHPAGPGAAEIPGSTPLAAQQGARGQRGEGLAAAVLPDALRRDGQLHLRSLLWLDLHGMSQVGARW